MHRPNHPLYANSLIKIIRTFKPYTLETGLLYNLKKSDNELTFQVLPVFSNESSGRLANLVTKAGRDVSSIQLSWTISIGLCLFPSSHTGNHLPQAAGPMYKKCWVIFTTNKVLRFIIINRTICTSRELRSMYIVQHSNRTIRTIRVLRPMYLVKQSNRTIRTTRVLRPMYLVQQSNRTIRTTRMCMQWFSTWKQYICRGPMYS